MALFRTNLPTAVATDDQQLYVIRRDFSGGTNTRQHASRIAENQVEQIENWDIGVVGETKKISGITLSKDLSNSAGTGALGFEPRGGTNELLVIHGQKLSGATSFAWAGADTYTDHKTDFTTGLQTSLVKVTCSGAKGDVVIVSNGTDNAFMMEQDHTMTDLADTNTSPPKTTVMTFYRNRLWALDNNALYWSAALPSTYAAQFDRTSNNYNVTVGTQRALIGLRDIGLICLGQDAVYGINPSITPAATDKPEKIIEIGCVANKTACLVGDDVFYLATDGVRGVFRSQQDKLQLGQTFPLSYSLKDEYDSINWGVISKATAIYWDNKYFIALPTGSATYNNQVWVYYPANKSWQVIDGWNVGDWAKLKVSGEEVLCYIDSNDGSVYRAWYGDTNAGTAITATFIGREEDCGQPLITKNGGEIEIEAETAGSGNTLSVYVALDGSNFNLLGTMDLTSASAPALPVDLPFMLSDSFVVRKKFPLGNLGSWRTMQLKIVNSDSNTDPIILYGYSIITYAEEYQSE